MSIISPSELGQQLYKPEGELGLKVADNMNITNQKIYDLVMGNLQLENDNIVLEVGFGNGKLLSKYFKMNDSITLFGIDFSEIMCIEANKNNEELILENKLKIFCEDSSNTHFESNTFDRIITINTIYFWENIEKQIIEFIRVLKPHGQILIGFRPKSSMEKLPFTKEKFRHFELEQVVSLFEQFNFKLISSNSQNTIIKAVDGLNVESKDYCLIFEK